MKALIFGMLFSLPSFCFGACTTLSTGLGLKLPTVGDNGSVWASCLRDNFTVLNSSVSMAFSSTTYTGQNNFTNNVAIGTSTVSAERLRVISSASQIGIMDSTDNRLWNINADSTELRISDETAGANRIKILSGGTVAIGDSSTATGKLRIVGAGTGSGTYGIQILNSGDITANMWVRDDGAGYLNDTAWGYASDRNLKENIIPIVSGIDIIKQLIPSRFDYKKGTKNQVGFIAQDVQKVIPDIVMMSPEGTLYMKTDSILPYLVKAVQEQQKQIENLILRIEILENNP